MFIFVHFQLYTQMQWDRLEGDESFNTVCLSIIPNASVFARSNMGKTEKTLYCLYIISGYSCVTHPQDALNIWRYWATVFFVSEFRTLAILTHLLNSIQVVSLINLTTKQQILKSSGDNKWTALVCCVGCSDCILSKNGNKNTYNFQFFCSTLHTKDILKI